MHKVTVRFGFPVYAVLAAFSAFTAWAVLIGVSNYFSYGYFHKIYNNHFYFLAGFFLLLVFMATRVFPAYRVDISDEGIRRTYKITLFGLKIWEDKYGNAEWSDVDFLDTFNIGWLWGLALHFTVKGKHRMVLLNRSYTSRKKALTKIVSKLPEQKITEKARKKLEKMGIRVG